MQYLFLLFMNIWHMHIQIVYINLKLHVFVHIKKQNSCWLISYFFFALSNLIYCN